MCLTLALVDRDRYFETKIVQKIKVFKSFFILYYSLLQNALHSQRVSGLIKTAETMGILDTSTESAKQSDIDEILGFLAALEKVLSIWKIDRLKSSDQASF